MMEAFSRVSCRKAEGLSGIFFVWGKIADTAQAPFRDDRHSLSSRTITL
jgi:hypothetical protein